MAEILIFSEIYLYNTLKTGIEVPVSLAFGGEAIAFDAKIDTGASYCIFERKHGERLGLSVESGFRENFSTAAGGFIAYGHDVELSVLGVKTYSTVFFAEEESFTRNVLGRQGFLDRVKLGLDDYEGKLFLAANNADFQ